MPSAEWRRWRHRYCAERLGYRKPASTVPVVDGEPGQELQADFGRLGMINDATHAIGEISETIGQINGIQATIAAAVEEQSATNDEIARSIAEAAQGTAEIASNVATVAVAANQTAEGASSTQQSAHELTGVASDLQGIVGADGRVEVRTPQRSRAAQARELADRQPGGGQGDWTYLEGELDELIRR